MPYVHTSVDADDTPVHIAVKVVDRSIATLSLFRAGLPQKPIERVSSRLAQAYAEHRTLSFYGADNSGAVAQLALLRFSRLEFNTASYSHGYPQLLNAASRKRGRRGGSFCLWPDERTAGVRRCDRKAGRYRRSGHRHRFSLAAIGSIHLATDPLEDMDRYMPMSSRLLLLVVIGIVATAMALQMGGANLQDQLQRTQTQLRHRRYA